MPQRAHNPAIHVIAWLLLAMPLALFIVRGLLWSGAKLWDFSVIYAASCVWAEGGDPYDQQHLNEWWSAHAAASPHVPADLSWMPMMVPPTTLAAISPFAAL